MQQDYTAYHCHYNTLLLLLPFPVDAQLSSTVAELVHLVYKDGEMSNTLSSRTASWTKPSNPQWDLRESCFLDFSMTEEKCILEAFPRLFKYFHSININVMAADRMPLAVMEQKQAQWWDRHLDPSIGAAVGYTHKWIVFHLHCNSRRHPYNHIWVRNVLELKLFLSTWNCIRFNPLPH